tara:strand:- start:2352 stop:3134 length:783 start_codon:yes stop_codon:yes gene_type:complete
MDLREVKERGNKQEQRHPWELARAEVITHQLKTKLNIETYSNVLDMGCGDTYLVELLAHRFPQVTFYAVDIAFTDEQLDSLRINTATNVRVYKSLDVVKPENNQPFDGVLLLDVIEHIEDEVDFLTQLSKNKFINQQTKFLITVPAYQVLFCEHDHFLGHYRRYTNGALKKRIGLTPLKVTSCGYFFSVLLVPRIIEVLKEKMSSDKKKTTGLVEWHGRHFVSKVIKSILFTDYLIHFALSKLGIKVPGLSNIAVCQLPA